MKDYWASAATYDQDEEYWPEPKEPCPLCGGEADWCPVCEGVVTPQFTAVWARACEAAQVRTLRSRTLASKPPGTCSACTYQEQMGRRCPEPHPPNRVAPCYSGPMAGPERLPAEPATGTTNNDAFWAEFVSRPLAPPGYPSCEDAKPGEWYRCGGGWRLEKKDPSRPGRIHARVVTHPGVAVWFTTRTRADGWSASRYAPSESEAVARAESQLAADAHNATFRLAFG